MLRHSAPGCRPARPGPAALMGLGRRPIAVTSRNLRQGLNASIAIEKTDVIYLEIPFFRLHPVVQSTLLRTQNEAGTGSFQGSADLAFEKIPTMGRDDMRIFAHRMAWCCATGAIAVATSAFAQDAEPAVDGGLSTITVTATRTGATDLQTTPIAVTALSADDLEQRSIDNLQDVAQYVPGLSIGNRTSGSAFGAIAIRGMGVDSLESAAAVGTYVDDVFFGSSGGNILGLMDTERVEVLRGPPGHFVRPQHHRRRNPVRDACSGSGFWRIPDRHRGQFRPRRCGCRTQHPVVRYFGSALCRAVQFHQRLRL